MERPYILLVSRDALQRHLSEKIDVLLSFGLLKESDK